VKAFIKRIFDDDDDDDDDSEMTNMRHILGADYACPSLLLIAKK